jgi:ribosomal protein S18 acetylase RimI-like enzyme
MSALSFATSVRRATRADAPALADLVNAAFAIEESFVDGDRTNAAEIAAMMEHGVFLVLDLIAPDSHGAHGLAGAVYVERRGYFGMLSVSPEFQGHGLGKRLVRLAEAVCEADGCATMSIRIVNLRDELSRWYRSLGYRETGVTPYAQTQRVAKRTGVWFVEMQRSLAAAA